MSVPFNNEKAQMAAACLNNQEITNTNPDSEMAILNNVANTRIIPLKISTVTGTTSASSHILLNSYIINNVDKVSNLYQRYLNWLIKEYPEIMHKL